MDISTLDTTGNATLVLKHPVTGKDLDITIELPGIDSKLYFDTLEKLSKVEGGIMANKIPLEVAKGCVLGWHNVDIGKDKLVCTPDNVEKFAKHCPWILEQISAFMVDRANFLPEPKSE